MFGQVMYFTMATDLISHIIREGNHITSSTGTVVGFRNQEGKVAAFAVYKNLGDSKMETIYEGEDIKRATDCYISTVGVLDAIGHATKWHRDNRVI
jgi:hypothetical protein